jgi:NhaA family Na+:H+ antiporter
MKDFLALESAGGILLVCAAALALVFANSPLRDLYAGFLGVRVEVRVGLLEIAKPMLLWINDGLMAVFFSSSAWSSSASSRTASCRSPRK